MNIFLPLKKTKDFLFKACFISYYFLKKRRSRVWSRFRNSFYRDSHLRSLIMFILIVSWAKGSDDQLDKYLHALYCSSVGVTLFYVSCLLAGSFFEEFDIFFKDVEANSWHLPEE